MPLVPILLALGGATLGASLFATWFDVGAEGLRFSGFSEPSVGQLALVRESLAQSGWEFWDGGDVALFALAAGLVVLAAYDAARREVPHAVLLAGGLLCAAALALLLAAGFSGDTVVLAEGLLGENAGEVRIERERAGGQWVALIGLVVAAGALALGWRERRTT